MATTRAALTEHDIRMLVKGATPDERALAAHKLCRTSTAPSWTTSSAAGRTRSCG
jgi:uncharacterized protein (DUF2336 family)